MKEDKMSYQSISHFRTLDDSVINCHNDDYDLEDTYNYHLPSYRLNLNDDGSFIDEDNPFSPYSDPFFDEPEYTGYLLYGPNWKGNDMDNESIAYLFEKELFEDKRPDIRKYREMYLNRYILN